MNPRLANSTSPYLRAHAGNPVAWFPWGEEAFAEARRRDVPVMVSIGYSTCHWCHVMARESFEDAATAAELDAGFVAIKVDREEHPEVDATYMAAASAFSPSLGWPLTVFATPDGRPFYAGTYFPPEPRAGIPSFRQVLAAVQEAWTERRDQIDETADAVAGALAEVRDAEPGPGTAGERAEAPTADDLVAAARALAAREDPRHGGFGDPASNAPKFPVATALRFLQTRLVRERAPAASVVADRALAVMASSPLRDPVEGGFFRYATRPDWTVPHYERMLTDNAQLLDVAMDTLPMDAVAIQAAPLPEDVARGLAGFLTEVLQQPGGGFGAAQDSESWIDGVRSEGGYYLRDAAGRATLEPPAVDGKVVSGWNGLAIGALARAGARLGEDRWIEAARWAADAVLETSVAADGRLLRASLDEVPSRAHATLADHGQLAAGLLALAVATGEVAYAVRARELVDACVGPDDRAAVPGGGDPVLTGQGIGAPDAASDADEPSGPAALGEAAAALWTLGAGDQYRSFAERLVATHASAALAQPLAYGALLRVATTLAVAPRQLVVVTDDADAAIATAARGIRADVVSVVSPEQVTAWADAGFGLFADKALRDGQATAYDCRDFACRLPVTDEAALEA
ncbi:thioredoxin domain-containing protein [Microbacterium sp. ZW T2_14]|uniref:thioredoxin domain-containing protein n=1 Tax=Microbacterium sp. ZW T2_14 TaxID=3378079 RepID=UPI0038524C64